MKMKKLSPEEISNLTAEKAFEIIQDYGALFANEKISAYEFQNKLPWPSDLILLSGITLLKHMRHSKLTDNDDEFIEVMSSLLSYLPTFIPSPEEYKKLLEIKKVTDKVKRRIR